MSLVKRKTPFSSNSETPDNVRLVVVGFESLKPGKKSSVGWEEEGEIKRKNRVDRSGKKQAMFKGQGIGEINQGR